MTNWTEQSTIETSWDVGTGINNLTSLNYSNPFLYNVDFITYDGRYVEGNTDWGQAPQLQTSWKES